MDESSKKANPDLAPLTVGHGRKLFDQNKEIATLLGQMQPLLALIEKEGVEPTDNPGSLITNVHVALGQEAQDFSMVSSLDGTKHWRPQGGNGNRVGIVGVVLVGTIAGQHPDPRCQGGRNVEHVFALGHELLGQQIAQSTRRLNGPGARLEGSAQLINWSTWRRVALTLTLES